MQTFLMGIDIGTSACKVALFSPGGRVEAQATQPYATFHPHPGWAEQNPEDWWDAVCAATRRMLGESGIDPGGIVGIGIDGQSWSAIPVSGAGEVLCNTPIWMDTRAAGVCEELDRRIGEERVFALCGNPLQPSYTLPKILWYKAHLPEAYRRAEKILQCNSFLVYRLTGVFSQDLSQGYGLHCFDMRRGRWDEAMCGEMGVRKELLPEIVPCSQIVGGVTPEAARRCGLRPGIPVVAGGLDAACGTLGAGVLRAGQTQEQGGQAGGMSICLEEYRADPRLILSFHVAPDRWLLQGGTVGGGGVVRWFEEQFGAEERETAARNGTRALAEMDALAAAVSPGSEGVVFLPYMSGERSPIWNPKAKGVYYGLDYAKTRGHLLRASMEGAAYSLRHNLEVAEAAGAPVQRLRAMGGAANSRLWTQIKADLTGKPVDVPASDTATTLGAAILAGVAVGVYNSFDNAVDSTVKVTRTHEPDPANKPAYDEGYSVYRALYRQLEPVMNERGEC